MSTFCTADEIATAIVAAARIEGEDPEAIARGLLGSRARWYAFAALVDRFPENDYRAIALGVGIFNINSMSAARAQLKSYRRGNAPKWWDEAIVAKVASALDGLHIVAPSPPLSVLPEDVPLGLAAPAPIAVMRDVEAIPRPHASYARRSNRTAAILGDPEPGRSALAQRHKTESADG
ncbi:MAG TPA: hypothetical protein VIG36_11225 [Methylocystis sp.]|jgi:hypothetical protein